MVVVSLLQQWLQEQYYPYWIITIIITTFSLFLLIYRVVPSKKLNLPPCLPTLPLLGNLHQLGSLPHRSMRALSQKHGPLMLLHLGKVPTIIISSAELAREVMKTHDLIFSSRPPSSMASRLMYNYLDISFAPYGEYWRQVRRIAILHLLSLKRIHSFRAIREEEVSLMVDRIHASEGLVNLSEIMVALTNCVVCRVAFGRKYENSGGFHKMLLEFLALLGTFPVKDFIPWLGWLDRLSGLDERVENNSREMDSFFEEVLEDHIHSSASETGNFLDVLLSLDVSLSRDSIKAIILDMFAAGTDTTFTVLDWTMAELIRNTGVMKKVQEEIKEVVEGKRNVSEEDIDQMSYLKAVIKEVLRLHPPLPLLVPRESTERVKLHGFEIPTKTRVTINAWAIGRDPKTWERPEEFWPERFLNSTVVDFKGQDFQFIPFGAGRRGCPGIMFAMSTIELALATLLHHFDWKMPDGMSAEELDMSESSGLTVHRKTSLVVQATPKF